MRSDEWLAGLYEGEGSLSHYRNAWVLGIAMTDQDIVQAAREVAGAGRIENVKPQCVGYKPQFRWVVTNRDDIAHVMTRLLPYLGTRRSERVSVFMEWNNTYPRRAGVRSTTANARRQREYRARRASTR